MIKAAEKQVQKKFFHTVFDVHPKDFLSDKDLCLTAA
jgi:hypothetical protein